MHVPDLQRTRLADRPERVQAWRPTVPGLAEVLHAEFVGHVYPAHTHSVWTLLLIDFGTVRYELERAEHAAVPGRVTLLPPHVAHTGRAGTPSGFGKRVLYVDGTVLPDELAGAAVDMPSLSDPVLHHRVRQVHEALHDESRALEAESRLALVADRICEHLRPGRRRRPSGTARLARELRELLDARITEGITLRQAGVVLGAHPDSLVRAFSAAFGLPPHRYLIARRVERARILLLAGHPVSEVAAAVGFHDAPHLTRHFRRQVGVAPARYAAG